MRVRASSLKCAFTVGPFTRRARAYEGRYEHHLGIVPFLYRLEKRVFIQQEQLPALLCIPGLSGPLDFKSS